MSSVSTTVGTSTYSTSYTYDTLGRITASTQNVPGYAQFKFQYGYSLTDQLTSMTYPALGAGTGRQVNYLLDAADRVQTVQNGTGGGNYASIGYTPANGEQSVTMGNGVTQQVTWNDRLQAVGLSAATAQGSLLTMGWYPCPQNQTQNQTSCATSTNAGVTTGNNGNLFFQTVSFPAIGNVPGLNLTQSYTYDQLGRLKTAGEGTGSWSQTYGYTNGNRYVSANSGFSLSASTPTVASNFDSNNRLQVNGAAYDNGQPSGNGNQTAIGGYTYTYDAENRMVSAVLNAGATLVSSAGYVYDGAGQRVQKMTCWSSVPCTPSSSDATVTTYVYDAFGNLAQEYGAYLNAWCATPTCYLTQDQIGSTRMVTDANGLVGTRYDFLPFGEEVPAGTGGRTLSMGYNGWEDNSNPKFAGQMRDPESARDLMGFRYYSPQEGRFVSVDPGNAGADNGTPETWNGYSYVVNNPLSYTDPSGLGIPDWLKDLFGIGDNEANTQSAGNGLQTLGQPPAANFYAEGWCYGCLPTRGWLNWLGTVGDLGSAVYDVGPNIIRGLVFFAQARGRLPSDRPLHCQEDVISAMKTIWAQSANGTSGAEASFNVNGRPSNYSIHLNPFM
jgi:RHS repeat-associated protein